jgi:extracellular matrix regulatory protein B
MYIHIGEETLVRTREIIAILDKDSVHSSQYIQEFLQQNENHTENLSKNSFKSIVVTEKKIFLSPLASATLKKRSQLLNVTDY